MRRSVLTRRLARLLRLVVFVRRQLCVPFALTHCFCYPSEVVASSKCYQQVGSLRLFNKGNTLRSRQQRGVHLVTVLGEANARGKTVVAIQWGLGQGAPVQSLSRGTTAPPILWVWCDQGSDEDLQAPVSPVPDSETGSETGSSWIHSGQFLPYAGGRISGRDRPCSVERPPRAHHRESAGRRWRDRELWAQRRARSFSRQRITIQSSSPRSVLSK